MNIYNEIKRLEKKGVFICYCFDHYTNGTNCNFSIEFAYRLPANKSIHHSDRKGKQYKTGLYGDNNEFGNTADTMVASIKIAKWLFKDNNVAKYFEDAPLYNLTETITNKGHKKYLKMRACRIKFDKMVEKLYAKKIPLRN